jgi:beta-glucosidase
VLWRLDHGNFDGLSPKLIVIMIGTNNTGHRQDPAADTAAGIKAILDKLASKCPKSKVLLLAIFPRGEKGDDGARTINDGVNLIIKGYADNKRVFYRDIASQFMDGKGVVNKELMPDLLHLTARGYQLWAEAIEGDVAKLMGEKAKPAKAPEPEPKPAEATPKPK